MSDMNKEEFIEQLSTIPEPPESELNTHHLEEPFEDLKSLTDDFSTEFTDDVLYQMILNGENNMIFIQYMLNLSQDDFSEEIEDYTDKSTFEAQIKNIVEEARRGRLSEHSNEAKKFTSHLASEYSDVLREEWVIAKGDLTHEMLLEARYREKRRSAIEGQQHGKYIENKVEDALLNSGLTTDAYEMDATPPVGQSDKDVDFVIPSLNLLIECKGYVTTGTKLYDGVGDVRKVDAPDDWAFVLVIDGDVLADLDPLLAEFQSTVNEGILDGIYQIDDIDTLVDDIEDIQSGGDVTFLSKTPPEIQASLTEIPTEDLELTGEDERIRAFEMLESTYNDDSPVDTLTQALTNDSIVLDVLRLIFDRSEGRFATEMHPFIESSDIEYPNYDKIVDLIEAERDEEVSRPIIEGLCEAEELIQYVDLFFEKEVSYLDIVGNRYLQKAGISIKSEYTGEFLEDKIEGILQDEGYVRNEHYYQNKKAVFPIDEEEIETGKGPDFVMPSLHTPSIVIEVKGFTSDGSKQTDVKGDLVEKFIDQIPDRYRDGTDVILFTDGDGWKLRTSDLEDLIGLHNDGTIDGLYQINTLHELENHITEAITAPTQPQNSLDDYH